MLLFSLEPQAAGAASAPSAYTGEAVDLTSSSATLNGSIGPANEETSYYFEYGTSAAYGAQTPTTLAGAGTQAIHVSAPLTGLAAGVVGTYASMGRLRPRRSARWSVSNCSGPDTGR